MGPVSFVTALGHQRWRRQDGPSLDFGRVVPSLFLLFVVSVKATPGNSQTLSSL